MIFFNIKDLINYVWIYLLIILCIYYIHWQIQEAPGVCPPNRIQLFHFCTCYHTKAMCLRLAPPNRLWPLNVKSWIRNWYMYMYVCMYTYVCMYVCICIYVYLLCLYIYKQCDYTKSEIMTKCYKNNTPKLILSNLQRNVIIVM